MKLVNAGEPAGRVERVGQTDRADRADRADRIDRIDRVRAEAAVADLLRALGQDLDDPQLRETPRRVVASLSGMLTPPAFNPTTFPNEDHYDELVVARDIPVRSLCAHHMLPFVGVAHVAYLPGERIVGLSKLARVVEKFASGLQVQERLTVQVGQWIAEHLQPRGVGVVIEAEHLCMTLRGVKARGARTVTSSLHGAIRDDPRTRAEFLALTHGSP
ncbi:MAG TPA: GTP cyclohydrolase I [Kofleriaceae bacterium]|nr:GTP cyclohydrolase I [Kofleriaceae bacterium]